MATSYSMNWRDLMEWLIFFVISWIVFFLLVDWKKLKINIWSGLSAIVFAVVVDSHNVLDHHRYIINNPIIDIKGSSMFFLLGPVFVMGTLMTQYHPQKRLMTVLHVLMICIFYTSMEVILVYRGALQYLDWHLRDSIQVNLTVLTTLSWFSIVVLNKWRD